MFTILSQASVGCVAGSVVLGVGAAPRSLMFTLQTASLILCAISFLMALAHLNKPAAAYRLVKAFPRSRLSRESVSFGVYFAVLAVWWLLGMLGVAGVVSSSDGWLGGMALLAGLACVLLEAQVYLTPACPIWRHWSTVLAFYSCALTLGAAAALVVSLGWPTLQVETPDALLALRLIVIAALLGSIVAAWRRIAHTHGALWRWQLFLGLGASLILVLLSFWWEWLVVLAWVVLLSGEMLDRVLFFSVSVPLSFEDERVFACRARQEVSREGGAA